MILSRVARVVSLKPAERRLLLEAFVLLGAVSPLLKYGPGALTGRVLRRASAMTCGPSDPEIVSAIAAAVTKAAPHVPGATCLARALAAWLMVTRRHEMATVRLGVRLESDSGFAAHAWLECNGRPVLGGETAHGYTPFRDFP